METIRNGSLDAVKLEQDTINHRNLIRLRKISLDLITISNSIITM